MGIEIKMPLLFSIPGGLEDISNLDEDAIAFLLGDRLDMPKEFRLK